MGYRTCEVDKDGRITIYPSLSDSGKKRPATLKAFLKKLIEVASGNGNNGNGTQKV